MKYYFIFFVILNFAGNNLYSQYEANVYLLVAPITTQEFDIYEDYNVKRNYLNGIYKIKNDSVVIFDTLSYRPYHSVLNVYQFDEENTILLEERVYPVIGAPSINTFIDYEERKIIKRKSKTNLKGLNENFSIKDTMYNSYSKVLLLDGSVYIFNEKMYSQLLFIGYDKRFNIQTVLPNSFQYFYRSGASSFFQSQPYFFYKYKDDDNRSTLKNSLGQKYFEDMPDAWIQIPKDFRDSTIEYVNIMINNSRCFVGEGKSEILGDNQLPLGYLWIYNKETELLDSIYLNGAEEYTLRNDGDWLYGTGKLKEVFVYPPTDESNAKDLAKYLLNDSLTRDRYNEEIGNVPTLYDKTGTFFLYHLPTNKQFTWNTGERDSEILLMKGNNIFYRRYDELRRVTIDPDRLAVDFSSDTLIVKDSNIVPFVHHIFFSSTTQTKCEEVWVNK